MGLGRGGLHGGRGYGIWYRLLQRYPVTTVLPLSLLAPTFGVLCGIFMLGEPASLEKLSGAAITLAGVAIVILAPRPTPASAPKEST